MQHVRDWVIAGEYMALGTDPSNFTKLPHTVQCGFIKPECIADDFKADAETKFQIRVHVKKVMWKLKTFRELPDDEQYGCSNELGEKVFEVLKEKRDIFVEIMRNRGRKWQFILYGGGHHDNPDENYTAHCLKKRAELQEILKNRGHDVVIIPQDAGWQLAYQILKHNDCSSYYGSAFVAITHGAGETITFKDGHITFVQSLQLMWSNAALSQHKLFAPIVCRKILDGVQQKQFISPLQMKDCGSISTLYGCKIGGQSVIGFADVLIKVLKRSLDGADLESVLLEILRDYRATEQMIGEVYLSLNEDVKI